MKEDTPPPKSARSDLSRTLEEPVLLKDVEMRCTSYISTKYTRYADPASQLIHLPRVLWSKSQNLSSRKPYLKSKTHEQSKKKSAKRRLWTSRILQKAIHKKPSRKSLKSLSET